MSGQQHAPVAFYPWERHCTHFTGGWVGPRPVWTGGKSHPHRDSISEKTTGCITQCMVLRQLTRKSRYSFTDWESAGYYFRNFFLNLFLSINYSTIFMSSLYDPPERTYIRRRYYLSVCLSVLIYVIIKF